jgi:hypothetical protein
VTSAAHDHWIDIYYLQTLTDQTRVIDLLQYFAGMTANCPIKEFKMKLYEENNSIVNTAVTPFSDQENGGTDFTETGFVISGNDIKISHFDVATFTINIKAIVPLVTPYKAKMMIFRMSCWSETSITGSFNSGCPPAVLKVDWNYEFSAAPSGLSNEVKLVVQKHDGNDFEFDINANVLQWTTSRNEAKCMLKKISVCNSNTSCNLLANPNPFPLSTTVQLKKSGGTA